jgi:uncharacterized DUF497 family protein
VGPSVTYQHDEKNRINQQKHGGLAFETAALVFNDPLPLFRKDRIVEGEQRWQAIGSAVGAVLLVVHLYRLEDTHDEEENIRIISAREANKRERRIYLQQASE